MEIFKATAGFFAVAAALVSVSCGDSSKASLIPDAPAPAEIEPFDPEKMQLFFTLNLEQTKSLLKNNAETIIIDVRSGHEFAQGHITGALNYDAESTGFADEIGTLDRGARLLIYGDAENIRADLALLKLKELGFRQVNRLSEPFETWKEAGLPFIQDLP